MTKSPLNELFDKIYVINLDKRKDRLEATNEQMSKHNIVYERFKALSPTDILLKPQYQKFKIYPKEKWGAICCGQSHKFLLERALKQNKTILICEDDVTFCDNFNEVLANKLITLPSDWNVLHFGYNRNESYVYTNKMVTFTKINDDWEQFDGFSGTTCWGFKPEVIPTFLEYFNKYPVQNMFGTFHIDLMFTCMRIYDDPRIKMYSTIDPIIHHANIGDSDTGLN